MSLFAHSMCPTFHVMKVVLFIPSWHSEKVFEGKCQIQYDQIGQFLKVLGNEFAYKCIPKTLVTFWAILKRSTLCKNCCGIYLGKFWKHLGYIFTPISGHTGLIEQK